jgi:hypothetical protein
MYELGPLLVNHNGSQLVANPWTWARAANLLFIESPCGVGFSYSTAADTTADYTHTDNSTAADNMASLEKFYAAFPTLKQNDLYIAGESYAGIYVPMLAAAVHESNLRGTTDYNLKGMMAGNPVWDAQKMDASLAAFHHGHGLLSPRLFSAMQSACAGNPDTATGSFSDRLLSDSASDSTCGAATTAVQAAMEQFVDVNPYDVESTCFTPSAGNSEVGSVSEVSVGSMGGASDTAVQALWEQLVTAHPGVAVLGEQLRQTAPVAATAEAASARRLAVSGSASGSGAAAAAAGGGGGATIRAGLDQLAASQQAAAAQAKAAALRQAVRATRPAHPAVAAAAAATASLAQTIETRASSSSSPSSSSGNDGDDDDALGDGNGGGPPGGKTDSSLAAGGADVTCVDSVGGNTYLNRADVRAAMHTTDSAESWAICRDQGSFAYDAGPYYSSGAGAFTATPFYAELLEAGRYKILVYR